MIEVFITGTPVSQSRPRFARRGAFVTTYDAAPAKDYKAYVRMVAGQYMAAMGLEPIKRDIPLCIRLEIGLQRPKTKPKRYVLPTSKPDCDNFFKGITDAMESICYEADQQITHVTIQKRYSEQPGVLVMIWEDKF